VADPTSQIDRLNLALAERYRIERELGQGGMATAWYTNRAQPYSPCAICASFPAGRLE
jgi:hypothetical protein